MDAIGRLKRINNKGVAVVYIALLIVVLVAFVGLAVDLGYMYVAKGQLQNAADAAALAGATQLPDVTPYVKVKTEAEKFALANKAAGDDVVITDADIQIGNWDPTKPDNDKFNTTRTPKNAVKVVARRNVAGATAANQGMIQLFFGRIFSLLPGGGAGWPEMGTKAEAIATHPPRPAAGLTLCTQVCPTLLGQTITFYFDTTYATNTLGLPSMYIAAFTEYQNVNSVDFSKSNSLIMQYINGTAEAPIASTMCGNPIFTNNGAPNTALRSMQARLNNEKGTNGYWEIIVPLVSTSTGGCFTPAVQGSNTEPYTVTNFVKIRIIDIVDNPHPNFTAQIVQCIDCSQIDDVIGIFNSQLVK